MTDRRPLILAYHSVGPETSPLTVTEKALKEQMAFLRSSGYVSLTLSEAERKRHEGSLPPRSVVVTFDDGFKATLRAHAILAEFEFTGTLFVVTSFVSSDRPLAWFGLSPTGATPAPDSRSVDWDDARSLATAGWEIGSHTVTHPRLASCSAPDLLKSSQSQSGRSPTKSERAVQSLTHMEIRIRVWLRRHVELATVSAVPSREPTCTTSRSCARAWA